MISTRCLAIIVCAAGLSAQVTPSTQSTFNFSQRERGTVPYVQDYAVGGTGPITVGTCTGPYSACGGLETLLTSRTAPAILHIYFLGYGTNTLPPGTYTSTLTVTSSVQVNLTINLTIIPRTLPTVNSPSGNFAGCVNSNSTYFSDLDTCTVTQGYPGRGTFPIPPPGSTYTDPNFGAAVKTIVPISGVRQLYADSVKSSFNADHSLLFTQTTTGTLYASNPLTGADVYNFTGLNCADATWSGVNPMKFYCSDYGSNTLSSVTLVSPPNNWTLSGPLYRYSGGQSAAGGLTDGGDSDTSKDDYWCWFTQNGTDHKLAITNLANPATETYLADFSLIPTNATTCGNGAPAPCGRACTISKGADATTGYRYIVFSINPGDNNDRMEIYRWKVGDTVLTDLGAAAQDPNSPNRNPPTYTGKHCDAAAWAANNCLQPQHMDTVEINGHEYLALPVEEGQPYIVNMAFVRLDSPDNMFTNSEAGGQSFYAYVPEAVPYGADVHIGCAKNAPVCIMETDQDPQPVTYAVTSASNTAPIHITSARACGSSSACPPYTATAGDVMRFGGINGNTALNNGSCTVANPSGSSFDCAGTDGTKAGAYTSGGFFTPDVTPASRPHQGELMLIDATNAESNHFIVTRLAKHRDWMFSGQLVPSYYGQSHPVISTDGTLGAFESNFGYPEQLGVFGVQTGYGSTVLFSSIAITAPTAGLTVAGKSVALTAVGSTPSGVTLGKAQLQVDGKNVGIAVAGPGPYNFVFDSTPFVDGAHVLSVQTTDSLGMAASASVALTLNNGNSGVPIIVVTNPPVVTITAPAAGVTIADGNFTVTATATPDKGVTIANLQFKIDGTPVGALLTAAPYQITLASSSFTNGAHTISAVANDSTGTPGTAPGVGITISNSPALITSVPGGAPAGNQSGWLGMKFTVGPTPIAVNALGRIFAPGNSGAHTVKLVLASNESDVPGGSATVNMAGGSASHYTFTPLPAPVVLSANTAYYLVSQEVSGGDQSYSYSAVTSTNAATVNAPAYFVGYYQTIPASGSAYANANLRYTLYSNSPPAISFVTPAAGATVSGAHVPVSVTAAATGVSVLSKVQFQLDGANLGNPIPGSGPFNITLDTTNLLNRFHTLSAIATDSSNNTATATVQFKVNNLPGPTVAITSPASGASVSGKKVSVSAAATPATGLTIASVQFSVDGASFGTVNSSPYTTVLDTTSLTNGMHQLSATAVDSAGGTSTSANIAITVNNAAAPTVQITAPAASAVVSGTAVALSATASASAGLSISNVQFKLDGANLGSPVAGSSPYKMTLDSTTLTNANHTLTAVATDSNNVSTTSVQVQFSVSNKSAPAVSITAPAAAGVVSGTSVTVTASATAATGLTISSVQFKLDNTNLGQPVSGPGPYASTFDSTTLTNGAHTVSATATDSAGSSTTSASVSITVNNIVPPKVAISSPAGGATISGQTTVTATATAATGLTIASVQFKVDGNNFGALQKNGGPYSATLDTTQLTNGGHNLTAVATDSAGTPTTSAMVSVTVSNIAVSGPVATITSPAAGASLSGKTVQLSATATASGGRTVASLQFLLDGVSYGPAIVGVGPFTATLDTTTLTNGPHTIGATATDSGASSGNASPVQVTVANTTTTPDGIAFVTGATVGSPGNGFTGGLGMRFTVGASPVAVSSLGRMFLAGNTGAHQMKLVRAKDESDVPGASVTVNMTGGTVSQFVYGRLAAPVVLSANTAYYLVSQETAGGDQYYNSAQVTGTSMGTIDGPAYYVGLYELNNSPNNAYVPVNLLYRPATTTPPTVSIAAPLARAVLTGSSASLRRPRRARAARRFSTYSGSSME